jgi:hypothetical protein
VGLTRNGALVVKFGSTDRNSIEREAQRLKEMELVEGVHFTVKIPEESRYGYVLIRREGLEHAAWLSVRGKDEQQRRLAAEFVKHILERAKEEGDDVYEKVKEIIEEGMSRGSLGLEGFEGGCRGGGQKARGEGNRRRGRVRYGEKRQEVAED